MKKKPNFLKNIFPAELKEISRRRKQSGLPDNKIDKAPAPSSELGLIGLALSGGGIRSATFSLGIIQGFLKKKVFRFVDYLSTVSGGGYLGSCISSLLNTRGEVDTLFKDTADADVIKHLRNSSNYLAPPGLLNKLRLPLVIIRGIFLVSFLIMPVIIAAVIGTEILNEILYPYIPDNANFHVYLLGLAAILSVLFILYPFAMKAFGDRWKKRNQFELIMTGCFGLMIFLLVLFPMLKIIGDTVNYSIADLLDKLGKLFENPHVKWGIIGFLIVIALLLFTKLKIMLIRMIVGFLGPAIAIAIYIFLCIFFIESPFIDSDYEKYLPEKTGQQITLKKTEELNETPAYKSFIKMLKNQKLIDKAPDEIQIEKANAGKWVVCIEEDKEVNRFDILKKSGYLFIPVCSITKGHASWTLYLIGMAIFIFNFLFIDANMISLNGFYRDRLSKAYLFQNDNNKKNDNDNDDIVSNDGQKISKLNDENSIAPYHLINTALNVPKSSDRDLRGRDTDFFTFSKHYSGSEITGYCKTEDMEKKDPHVNLGTAMAISGAAAAPEMGTMGMSQFTFIMTLLNIRLNYWVPNPSYIVRGKFMHRFTGPGYLLKEAIRDLSEKSKKVYLSDGGHIENSAIYQLLKRRCGLIIAVDVEGDPNMRFKGLSTLMRYAKIDMGIDIDIDLKKIYKNEEGLSKEHWTVGKITYPNKTGDREDSETGYLLYIKSSLKGDENEYIKAYRREHPIFPHQSTADQFFTETQFEVYRALGEKIADGILNDLEKDKLESVNSPEDFIVCIEENYRRKRNEDNSRQRRTGKG